ncbi:Exopolysaccharide biosynthesis protein related to N-acetylglucosamine-1-phosphodiester alpha-N-acetylglucosaminidase [Thiorhodovibrio winogradskyi]|uniref:Exopolysaccharide biosynthesis protein related to N-acetylglucosamine-1-phosphodiester alpha-N-acetylglucosaminidase n=1 Tax=Thiorhodovibrio winogradskyi TaxID=77007 RepID=A0ABZ0S7R6_9GAMM|nr:phosphodiester glycosidase family protein [Thiorhodovibrio winogradskyi]
MAAEIMIGTKDHDRSFGGANLFAAALQWRPGRCGKPRARQSRGWPWLARPLSWLLPALMLTTTTAPASDWQPLEPRPELLAKADLAYAEASAQRQSDGQRIGVHLAFFHSRAFRLAVVDLASIDSNPKKRIDAVFRGAGIPAGINGGFFHPNGRPLGLVVADGQRINRLERAKLLSGVLYADADGNYLRRHGAFHDHAGIDALLQTGPYLVEYGRAVRGLRTAPVARRSFAATDWRGHWVLGATRNPISLADLSDCLASLGCLTDWPVERAINLDGGSSTGFFFERGSGQGAVVVHPLKPVRNLLGICPR